MIGRGGKVIFTLKEIKSTLIELYSICVPVFYFISVQSDPNHFKNKVLGQKQGNVTSIFSYLLDGHVLPSLETP